VLRLIENTTVTVAVAAKITVTVTAPRWCSAFARASFDGAYDRNRSITVPAQALSEEAAAVERAKKQALAEHAARLEQVRANPWGWMAYMRDIAMVLLLLLSL